MKRRSLMFVALAFLFMMQATSLVTSVEALSGQELKVLLAYNPAYLKTSPHILAAYESVLQEEGVSFESMDVFQLAKANVDTVVQTHPVIILPDNLLQSVPARFNEWIKQYLSRGGNIAISYDVGIKAEDGFYLDKSEFADLVGLNYITYKTMGAAAYDIGHVRYASEASRDLFQIPLGKTMNKVILSSYTYGELQYPIARNEWVRDLPAISIHAYGVTKKNEKYPLIVLTDYQKGKILYINLPLGHLKAFSDDLPLRSTLRSFLFDIVGIPHVMNVENGRGGIVFNWHVDSDIEHIALPYLLKKGIFRKELAYSIHVTAGEFFLKPGDDTGFDAAGQGKHLVLALKDYGMIGSHGGWAHNWFSENINNGTFKEKEIREYIAKNNDALEKIVGYKIVEYAAPNGAHPQPAATRALESLGIIAYYYVGDTGSAPNRAFAEGKMVSDKAIAFPIMPMGKYGSIWEIRELGKTPDREVAEWFSSNLDYVVRNRTVRLIYSHPYDYQNYPDVISKFFDNVVKRQADQELVVRPMSAFAHFFLRFLKTTYSFRSEKSQLLVSLNNPDGLEGITVALPRKSYKKPAVEGLSVQEDAQYFYLTVVGKHEREKSFTVDTL